MVKKTKAVEFNEKIQAIKNSKLRDIDFYKFELNDDDVKTLCDAFSENKIWCKKNVRNICVSYNLIGKEMMLEFGRILRDFERLYSINFEENALGPEGIRLFFDNFRSNQSVRIINLASNYIENAVLYISEYLLANQSVQILNLADNSIGGEGIEIFSKCLRNNYTLLELNLECNDLGGEGILSLTKALSTNDTLQNLNLYGTGFGNEGCRHVANLLKSDSKIKFF